MYSLTWSALTNMQRRERAVPVDFVFADSGIDVAVTATGFAGYRRPCPQGVRRTTGNGGRGCAASV